MLLLFPSVASAGKLHDAAATGNTEKALELLKGGAPVDSLDEEQRTPLQRATENGHVETVRLLLEHKAKVDYYKAGHPPYLGALYNHPRIAVVLVQYGAEHYDYDCDTLAHAFVRKGFAVPDAQAIRTALPKAYAFLATVLWHLGPKAAPFLLDWVNDDDPIIRRAAAVAFGGHLQGDVGTLKALARLLSDDDAETRRLAIGACTRIHWPKKPKGELADAKKQALLALSAQGRGRSPLVPRARMAYAIVKGNGNVGVIGHPLGRQARRAQHRKLRRALAEPAVELGLQWLARTSKAGSWKSDRFGGRPYRDAGVTGLATLAFLGAGHTPGDGGPYAETMSDALDYLLIRQEDSGSFTSTVLDKHFMYSHAIATLAMCEAAILTDIPVYRQAAERGVHFVAQAQNKASGGWGYYSRDDDPDTSITGWCVRVLHLGRLAGFEVDPSAFDGAMAWIDQMTYGWGTVGYKTPDGGSSRPKGLHKKFPPHRTEAMSAVGLLVRILLGENVRTSKDVRGGTENLLKELPEWNLRWGSLDMYYWFQGTMALHYLGGTPWRKWRKALLDTVLPHQRAADQGALAGSWDPVGVWGADGGRVYSTAIMVLTLETTYRHALPK